MAPVISVYISATCPTWTTDIDRYRLLPNVCNSTKVLDRDDIRSRFSSVQALTPGQGSKDVYAEKQSLRTYRKLILRISSLSSNFAELRRFAGLYLWMSLPWTCRSNNGFSTCSTTTQTTVTQPEIDKPVQTEYKGWR